MIFDVFIKKLDGITLNDMHFSTKQNGDWLEIYLNHGETPVFKISLTETFHMITVAKIRGAFEEWKKIADLCWEFASTPVNQRYIPYVLVLNSEKKAYLKFVTENGKWDLVGTNNPKVYRDFVLQYYKDVEPYLSETIDLTKRIAMEVLSDED